MLDASNDNATAARHQALIPDHIGILPLGIISGHSETKILGMTVPRRASTLRQRPALYFGSGADRCWLQRTADLAFLGIGRSIWGHQEAVISELRTWLRGWVASQVGNLRYFQQSRWRNMSQMDLGRIAGDIGRPSLPSRQNNPQVPSALLPRSNHGRAPQGSGGMDAHALKTPHAERRRPARCQERRRLAVKAGCIFGKPSVDPHADAMDEAPLTTGSPDLLRPSWQARGQLLPAEPRAGEPWKNGQKKHRERASQTEH